ncbi:MAG: 6-bladed beta-propeller [Nitrosomonadales bacterium]|nr:6-bladed beta-propeller [Nitrosomonadales bacterium]
MTKRLLVTILAITLASSGCMMSSTTSDKEKGPDKNKGKMVFPDPPEDPRFYYERTIKSSADVLPRTEEDKFRRAMTGEQLTGEGFGKPYGLAVHHGRVFVGDTIRHVVLVFDIPEQKFFMIGKDEEEGEGKLNKPMGLEVDHNGNLYVLDASYKQIIVYDRDGKFLRNIGNPNDFSRPAGIGVDAEGKRIYAVDIGGSSTDNHRILVYDAVSGERLPDIGKRGTQPGEFNLPRDAVVARDGTLFVVDGGNFRVQKLAADGKPITTFGSIGSQRGQFSRPKEAAVDGEGNVYVVDTAFGNFQIFNSDGQLLMHIGTRSNTDGPALYSLPSGIGIDEDGRIYIVDQYFRKIDVFRPATLDEDKGFVRKTTADK